MKKIKLPSEILLSFKNDIEKERYIQEHKREYDQISFWNMLIHHFPKEDVKKLWDEKELDILNIGCGKSYEAPILNSFFGKVSIKKNANHVKIYGIDIREDSIKQAEQLHTITELYKFFHHDARKLDEIKHLPRKFDIVLMRHPEIYHKKAFQKELISMAIKRLKKDGFFLFTIFTDIERIVLKRALKEFGLEIIVDELNEHAQNDFQLHPENFYDKYLIIAKQ